MTTKAKASAQKTATAAAQKNGKVASKDQLLKIRPVSREYQPKGYDIVVLIRALNAAEHSRYQNEIVRTSYEPGTGKPSFEARMEGHEPLLCSLGVERPRMSREEWGELPRDLVHDLANEIQKVSGTGEDAEGN